MTDPTYVIRALEGDPANRQVTVRAYSEATGEVVVTVPTADMDADALPEAIKHALSQKAEADDAANAAEVLGGTDDASTADESTGEGAPADPFAPGAQATSTTDSGEPSATS